MKFRERAVRKGAPDPVATELGDSIIPNMNARLQPMRWSERSRLSSDVEEKTKSVPDTIVESLFLPKVL